MHQRAWKLAVAERMTPFLFTTTKVTKYDSIYTHTVDQVTNTPHDESSPPKADGEKIIDEYHAEASTKLPFLIFVSAIAPVPVDRNYQVLMFSSTM